MAEKIARQIVLAARPQGRPQPSDFRLEETAIPTPSAGQVLLRVQYLSLDPYMRGRMDDRKSYATPVPLGGVMQGESVATVIASTTSRLLGRRHRACPHGMAHARAVGSRGPAQARSGRRAGHDGARRTRDARVHRVWRPARDRQARARETVVVAAASGPVGSLVGQLAKIAGARAVGIAGGPEKCAYVKDELRFDAAIDHRDTDFAAKLAAACPDGIDVYFENVGGAIWQAVLPLLNKFARVPVSGLIAQYNGVGKGDGTDRLPATMRADPVEEPDGARLPQQRICRRALSRIPARGRCRHRRWPHPLSRGLRRRSGERARSLHRHAGGTQLRQADRASGRIDARRERHT